MSRETQGSVWIICAKRLTTLEQRQVAFRIIEEPMLGVLYRFIFESAPTVQNRQKRDSNPGFGGSLQKLCRHLAEVGIGRTVRLMMQVVKFGNGGISF